MALDGRGMFRVKHISWWPQELPSQEEMNHGIETLDSIDWKCDFVVTHCAPSSVQAISGHGFYKNDYLNKYLEEIHQKLDYTKWFFGHMHHDRNVTSKDICLYEQIVQIN